MARGLYTAKDKKDEEERKRKQMIQAGAERRASNQSRKPKQTENAKQKTQTAQKKTAEQKKTIQAGAQRRASNRSQDGIKEELRLKSPAGVRGQLATAQTYHNIARDAGVTGTKLGLMGTKTTAISRRNAARESRVHTAPVSQAALKVQRDAERQRLSVFDENNLTPEQKVKVRQAKQLYNAASAKGDAKTANAAHAMAEKIRQERGYSGGAAGNTYLFRGGLPTAGAVDAYGRKRWEGTKEQAKEDAAGLAATGKAIGTGIVGSLASVGETAAQYVRNVNAKSSNKEYQKALAAHQRAYERMEYAYRYDFGNWEKYYQDWREKGEIVAKMTLELNRSVDPDKFGQRMLRKSQEYTQEAMDGQNALEREITQNVISMGQMLPGIGLGLLSGGAGLALMGAQAAGQKAGELNARGYEPGRALARGALSGGIEVLTERIPLKHLSGIVKNQEGKNLIKSVMAQMGIEGTEEGVSYVANTIADYAARDPEAEFVGTDLIRSVVGGGLSGGAFGVGGAFLGGTRAKGLPTGKERDAGQNVGQTGQNVGQTGQNVGQAGQNVGQAGQNVREREGSGGQSVDARVLPPPLRGTSLPEGGTGNGRLSEEEAVQREFASLVAAYQKAGTEGERREIVQRMQSAADVLDDIEAGVKPGQIGVVEDDYTAGMNQVVVREMDDVARDLGVMVRFVDEVDGGIANAKHDAGRIYIERGNPNPVRALFGHEATHRVQELAPDAYLAYRDFVMTTRMNEVEEKIADYAARGIELSRNRAMDEIAADYAGALVEDYDLLREFARRADRNVVERFLDALKEMVGKLTGKKRTQTEEAIRLLEEAVSAAGKNKNAVGMDGRARYSMVRDTGDVTPIGATLSENEVRYSLKDKKIPSYEEFVSKPDLKVVDIRSNALPMSESAFKRSEEAKRLIQGPVVNQDTGETLHITKNTISHSFSGSGAEKVAAIRKVREIVENAVLTHSEPSYREVDHTTGVYTFWGAVNTKNGVQPVKLKVKEYFNEGQDIPQSIREEIGENYDTYASVYDNRVLVVESIEKETNGSAALVSEKSATPDSPSASTIRVADLYALVNEKYRKYLPERKSLRGSSEWTDRISVPLSENEVRYSLKGADDYRRYSEKYAQDVERNAQDVEQVQEQKPVSDDASVPAGSLSHGEAVTAPSRREPVVGETEGRTEAKRIANRFLRRYGKSNLKADDLAGDIERLYETLRKGRGTGDWMRNPEAREIARGIADKVAENAVTQNTDLYDQYADLRKYLREQEILVGPELREQITDYGDWRRRQSGRMRIKTADRSNVDQVYQEMSERWPGLFDEREVSNEADQLEAIADTIQEIYERPKVAIFSDEERDEVASRIVDGVMQAVYAGRRRLEEQRIDERFQSIPVQDMPEAKVKGLPTGREDREARERAEILEETRANQRDAAHEEYADNLLDEVARYDDDYDEYAAMMQAEEDAYRRDLEDAEKARLGEAERDEAARQNNALEKADKMISTKGETDDRTFREKVRESKDFLYRRFVDSGDEVRKAGKEAGDDALYAMYNAVKSSTAAAQNWVSLQRSNSKGEKIGESLSDIFAPIKKKGDDYYRAFSSYLLHAHNVDRMGTEQDKWAADEIKRQLDEFDAIHPDTAELSMHDLKELAASGNADAQTRKSLLDEKRRRDNRIKPVFGYDVDARTSQAEVTRLAGLHPEFKELAQRVYDYEKDLMRLRVEAGLVTQELADKLWQIYPHYVPTYRVQDGQENRAISDNVRVGKGVKRATGGNNPLMAIDVAMGKQTMGTLREAAKNRFGQRLLNEKIGEGFVLSREKSENRVDEGDFDALWENTKPETENTFTVFKDGEAYDVVMTREMFDGIKAFTPETSYDNLKPVKAVRRANSLYKALITSKNPVFTAKNFIKDLQDALLYSQDLKGFAKNYPKAWKEIATGGENWRQYQALGGTASSVYDTEQGVQIPKDDLWHRLVSKIEAVNLAVEQSPRLAEFMALKEKGSGSMDDLEKAMLGAADITTNFGRSGEWGKFWNRNFVPFLNPSIQGADKLMRTFRDNDHTVKAWVMLAARCAALGVAPSIVNYLLCGDEEDYDKLRQDDIDMNYLIPVEDGKWIKIPKGRVLSVFSAMTNGTGRLLRGEEANLRGIVELAFEQAGPINPLNSNILKAWNDTKLFDPDNPGETWYGTDIENQRLQGMRPGERYDESTDVFSKFVGGKLGISPKKLNTLLDSYTGVFGDIALPLLTPTKTTGKNPLTKAFQLDTVMSNNLSEKFYDVSDELTYGKNDGDGQATVAAKWWGKIGDNISDLNKELRALENDKGLDTKAKRDAVREKKKEVNEAMEKALDNLEQYKAAVAKYYHDDSDGAIARTFFDANREVFGAEGAMELEGTDAYEKAKEAVANGDNWDNYAENYAYKKSAKNIAKMMKWDADDSGSLTNTELYEGIFNYTEDEDERNKLFDALKSSNSKTTFAEAGENAAKEKAREGKIQGLAKRYNMTEDEIATINDIDDVGSYKAVYQALSGMDISDADRNRYYAFINGKRNKAWKVTSWEGVVQYLKKHGEI